MGGRAKDETSTAKSPTRAKSPKPRGRAATPSTASSARSRSRSPVARKVTALDTKPRAKKGKPSWLLIAAIVFFNVIGKIGDAIGPAMVNDRPVSLLVLNASNTHCILTTTSVSFWPWILLCSLRRLLEDPLYFFLGWRYRGVALKFLEKWMPDVAEGFVAAEGMFQNNLYLAVAINPGATVCTLAGAAQMKRRWFISINVLSTVAQLLLMRYVCTMMPGQIDRVLEMIKTYVAILLAIMVCATLYPMVNSREQLQAIWKSKFSRKWATWKGKVSAKFGLK